jgi:preprotein translocase SecE subunit
MAAGIYKSGQGYWTRTMSAVAAGLLIAMGAVWLWDLLKNARIGEIEPVYVSAAGAALFFAVLGIIAFQLIARNPKLVDFMIATEGEMKKVNWSTRREIVGSTWVVIALTILIAVLCFVFDRVFQALFTWMEVLET